MTWAHRTKEGGNSATRDFSKMDLVVKVILLSKDFDNSKLNVRQFLSQFISLFYFMELSSTLSFSCFTPTSLKGINSWLCSFVIS